ncbi:MAG: orotidine-5'-phosphate decarboxylase [Desulfobacteraceae bacterium]|jgi:orotidine-5'-phosphate decarboxylase
MKHAKDYIIFPLDVPSTEEAKHYVDLLAGDVGMFKVGLELFIQAGPDIVKFIQGAGSTGIFLDLKLHDIPQTVSRAMGRIADLGVTFITVHCGENKRMLEAAVAGSQDKVGVLGVTVLTSVSPADIKTAGFRSDFHSDLSRLVLKRAEMAKSAGCAGVICSGLEAKAIKAALGPDFLAVTPGIRPSWSVTNGEDQQRITTPAQAIADGSDYLVIGRPIRDADDPKQAAKKITKEIRSVIQELRD